MDYTLKNENSYMKNIIDTLYLHYHPQDEIDNSNEYCKDIIEIIIKKCDLDTIKFMINHFNDYIIYGATTHIYAMELACKNSNLQLLEYLIELKVKCSATAMCIANYNQNKEIIKLLEDYTNEKVADF